MTTSADAVLEAVLLPTCPLGMVAGQMSAWLYENQCQAAHPAFVTALRQVLRRVLQSLRGAGGNVVQQKLLQLAVLHKTLHRALTAPSWGAPRLGSAAAWVQVDHVLTTAATLLYRRAMRMQLAAACAGHASAAHVVFDVVWPYVMASETDSLGPTE